MTDRHIHTHEVISESMKRTLILYNNCLELHVLTLPLTSYVLRYAVILYSNQKLIKILVWE